MTHGHPSGINLSSVPGDHVLRRRTDLEALEHVARLIESEMKGVARHWKMYRDYMPHSDRKMAERKAVYDGLNCAIGCVQQEWERRGFPGNVLRRMPPVDDVDDSGVSRDGIAEYVAMTEYDIPY